MVTLSHLLKLFTLFLIAAVSAADDIDESCYQIFDPESEQDCCETKFDFGDEDEEDFDDCQSDDSSDELKCEAIQCYYKHDGIWNDDGLDDEAAKKKLESIDSKDPLTNKVTQRMLKYCSNGKYMNYGKKDDCPAFKYFLCSYINIIVECDSWNKTGQCAKHSEYASKCKASLG